MFINYLQGLPQFQYKIMSSHIPEFYELIVEASEKGYLWGIDQVQNPSYPLETNFDPSVYM